MLGSGGPKTVVVGIIIGVALNLHGGWTIKGKLNRILSASTSAIITVGTVRVGSLIDLVVPVVPSENHSISSWRRGLDMHIDGHIAGFRATCYLCLCRMRPPPKLALRERKNPTLHEQKILGPETLFAY